MKRHQSDWPLFLFLGAFVVALFVTAVWLGARCDCKPGTTNATYFAENGDSMRVEVIHIGRGLMELRKQDGKKVFAVSGRIEHD